MQVINRAGPAPVALETTLLAHGVPRAQGLPLARELAGIVRARGASPAVVGILDGVPIVGLTDDEVERLLASAETPKVNTSNLGLALHRRHHGATTVSATLELAAAAGVRVFATGGIGGVHRGYGVRWDISADLGALARFPVAVVCSGVKSLLDVGATREALETLGIPVIGYRTDRLPAFYVRSSESPVDASFDDAEDLARYAGGELGRSGRAVVIAQPVPEGDAISPQQWSAWLDAAHQRLGHASAPGRDITPATLSALHDVSRGATLSANLALVRANASLAAQVAVAMNP